MLKGVFTPIITAFDENGKIDYEANGILIDRLIVNGIHGILFLGSMGEFFTMTADERKEYISYAINKVNKRAVVMIGTGGTNVDEVVELTSYAEKEGADAAVVISPYYFKLDEDSLYRYFAEVAGSIKMPVLLYNFPDRTGVDMSPQLVLRLAKDFRNIIGIKDTVDNISHTRKIIHMVKSQRQDFCVLSGFDEYLVPNLMAGGDGILTGLTNIAPEYFLEMYKAFEEMDFSTIATLQKKVNTLMGLYDISTPFIAAIKGAVAQRVKGINAEARKPAASLNEEQIYKIRKVLVEACLI